MRWRDAKKKAHKEVRISLPHSPIAPISKRLKAFVIDSFMLLMPLLYLVFYAVYGSREAFAQHQLEGWLMILVPYYIITTLFFFFKGQTPGYKAYDIVLVAPKNHSTLSIVRLSLRFFFFMLTCVSLFGLLLPLIRKDRLTLFDLLSHTKPIEK
jgi:uncharacterized RDD family membrane protein YckC